MRHKILLLTVFVLALLRPEIARTDATPSEYEVKAAFLINFARFTEWDPPLSPGGRPLEIGVIGEDPFGKALEKIAAEAQIQGRKVVILRLPVDSDGGTCRMVFLSSRDQKVVRGILARLEGRGILVVGDHPSAVKWGTVLAFNPREGKIRFNVNRSAAASQRLKLSSQILKLAVEVIR